MITIRIFDNAGVFAEDKDIAAQMREDKLKPALEKGAKVRIDFSGVDGATQSFVHALISEPIRKNGPSVLDSIEFKKCNPTVRSIVEIVVEYSQLVDGSNKSGDAAQQVAAPDGRSRRGRPRVSRRR